MVVAAVDLITRYSRQPRRLGSFFVATSKAMIWVHTGSNCGAGQTKRAWPVVTWRQKQFFCD